MPDERNEVDVAFCAPYRHIKTSMAVFRYRAGSKPLFRYFAVGRFKNRLMYKTLGEKSNVYRKH